MYIYTTSRVHKQQRLSNFDMLYQNEPVKFFEVNKMQLYKLFTIHILQILQVKFNNKIVLQLMAV